MVDISLMSTKVHKIETTFHSTHTHDNLAIVKALQLVLLVLTYPSPVGHSRPDYQRHARTREAT